MTATSRASGDAGGHEHEHEQVNEHAYDYVDVDVDGLRWSRSPGRRAPAALIESGSVTADVQPDPMTSAEPGAPVLSVVMPAYNEEATVLATIARVLSVPLELELIVGDGVQVGLYLIAFM